MRRRATKNKEKMLYPNSILLDHFDSIYSINEVERKPLLFRSDYMTSGSGVFGNAVRLEATLETTIKSYDLSDRQISFNKEDEFSIDFFFRGETNSSMDRFSLAFIDTNYTGTLSIAFVLQYPFSYMSVEVSDGLTSLAKISERYSYKQWYHFALSNSQKNGMRIYLNGGLKESFSVNRIREKASILRFNTSNWVLFDELYITQTDRSNNGISFPVPTAPYSLE